MAIKPPMLPNMTLVPMAELRAVSETTFALTWALQREPNANAPEAMMKVAPYLTAPCSEAKNMILQVIVSKGFEDV